MATLVRKRQELPKKVLMMDRIEEEQIVRLYDAKKLFFDWLKMNAIWARKVIADVVKPYYKDLRDVNKFVSWLLRSHTYVTCRAERKSRRRPSRRTPATDLSDGGELHFHAFAKGGETLHSRDHSADGQDRRCGPGTVVHAGRCGSEEDTQCPSRGPIRHFPDFHDLSGRSILWNVDPYASIVLIPPTGHLSRERQG